MSSASSGKFLFAPPPVAESTVKISSFRRQLSYEIIKKEFFNNYPFVFRRLYFFAFGQLCRWGGGE
jgi:hypothetical protein